MKTMHQWRTGLFALFGVLVVGVISAWAADCGDTAGPGGTDVACSCGDTVVTSTVLNATDPVVSTDPGDFCAGDGLIAGADGITLTLGGNTVRGDGTGTGISLVARSGVTVRSGRVTAFNTGVFLSNSSANVVTLLTLDANLTGVDLVYFGGPNTDNQIVRNTIKDTGLGIQLVGSAASPATGNVIATNKIVITGGGNAIVVTRANGDAANGVPGNRVSANVVSGDGNGISLLESSENIVEKNTVQANGGGVWLIGGLLLPPGPSDRNVVKNNQVSNSAFGMLVQCSASHNTIQANRFLDNWIHGLVVHQPVGCVGAPTGNTISANITDGNGFDGISIVGDGNAVIGNRGKKNGDDGLDIIGTGNQVDRNVFDQNGDWGICVDAGNFDSGGNRASRNGSGQISFTGACSH